MSDTFKPRNAKIVNGKRKELSPYEVFEIMSAKNPALITLKSRLSMVITESGE